MIWTLQSFLGQFVDAVVGQVVSALGGGSRPTPWNPPRNGAARRDTFHGSSAGAAPALPLPAWEPARDTAAPAERTVARAAPLDQDLLGDETKLVSYTIVSLRRCHERILPGGSGEVLVTLSMTDETFATWIVACYLQADDCPEEDRAAVARARRNEISYDEKKYLRVAYEVLSRWPSEPKDCCEDGKLGALEGIRDALLKLPPKPSHEVAATSTYAPGPLTVSEPPPSPPPPVASVKEASPAAPAAPEIPTAIEPAAPPLEKVRARKEIAKPAGRKTVPTPAPAAAPAPASRWRAPTPTATSGSKPAAARTVPERPVPAPPKAGRRPPGPARRKPR